MNIKKHAEKVERYFKGAANHHRIAILLLLSKNKSMNLENISEVLGSNMKTLSEHTGRLVRAGLVNKRYQGRQVLHSLSPYGERFVAFVKSFR